MYNAGVGEVNWCFWFHGSTALQNLGNTETENLSGLGHPGLDQGPRTLSMTFLSAQTSFCSSCFSFIVKFSFALNSLPLFSFKD